MYVSLTLKEPHLLYFYFIAAVTFHPGLSPNHGLKIRLPMISISSMLDIQDGSRLKSTNIVWMILNGKSLSWDWASKARTQPDKVLSLNFRDWRKRRRDRSRVWRISWSSCKRLSMLQICPSNRLRWKCPSFLTGKPSFKQCGIKCWTFDNWKI